MSWGASHCVYLAAPRTYPAAFGGSLAAHLVQSLCSPCANPPSVAVVHSDEDMVREFEAAMLQPDLWCDAHMYELVSYVYSNKYMLLPPLWQGPVRLAMRRLRMASKPPV